MFLTNRLIVNQCTHGTFIDTVHSGVGRTSLSLHQPSGTRFQMSSDDRGHFPTVAGDTTFVHRPSVPSELEVHMTIALYKIDVLLTYLLTYSKSFS